VVKGSVFENILDRPATTENVTNYTHQAQTLSAGRASWNIPAQALHLFSRQVLLQPGNC
jgi:hypothetical protein